MGLTFPSNQLELKNKPPSHLPAASTWEPSPYGEALCVDLRAVDLLSSQQEGDLDLI